MVQAQTGRRTARRLIGALLVGLVAAMALAACGGDDEESSSSAATQSTTTSTGSTAASTTTASTTQAGTSGTSATAAAAANTLEGTIEIDGSSTVAPITEAVAEEYRKVQGSVLVNVGISGSGGGFKRFTVGETDISDASRSIKGSEAATAAENGIEYHEFLVGVDGLSWSTSRTTSSRA